VKYRYRPGRRAIYSHGNTRLEMIWIIPAVILIVASLWASGSGIITVLIRGGDPNCADHGVAEQFQAEHDLSRPDGKLGQISRVSKTTDSRPGVSAASRSSFLVGRPPRRRAIA